MSDHQFSNKSVERQSGSAWQPVRSRPIEKQFNETSRRCSVTGTHLTDNLEQFLSSSIRIHLSQVNATSRPGGPRGHVRGRAVETRGGGSGDSAQRQGKSQQLRNCPSPCCRMGLRAMDSAASSTPLRLWSPADRLRGECRTHQVCRRRARH